MAIYVDEGWKGKEGGLEYAVDSKVKYINFKDNIGLTKYIWENGVPQLYLTSGGGGFGTYSNTPSTTAKEYYKVKLKLSDIDPKEFTEDGKLIIGENHITIAAETGANAALIFVSGAFITAPIPDSQGYVEVYVDKSNPSINYHACALSSSRGGYAKGYIKKDILAQSMPAPETGFSLMNIPAGEYTIRFYNMPEDCIYTEEHKITIKDTTSMQYFKATIHEHKYEGEWKNDSTNHWKVCCDKIGALSKHKYGSWVIDREATEEIEGSKHRNCTVCNYKQTKTIDKLKHTHKYSSDWLNNELKHWKECSCGDKKETTSHFSANEATEDKAKTCDVCGYIMEAALGHIKHTEDKTHFFYDENKHWYQCVGCTQKMGENIHNLEWIIDYEATVDMAGQKHEECVDCGYRKEAVEIPQLIVETEPETTESETTEPEITETPTTEPDTTEVPNTEETTTVEMQESKGVSGKPNWLIPAIVVCVAVMGIVIVIIVVKCKKKKEE